MSEFAAPENPTPRYYDCNLAENELGQSSRADVLFKDCSANEYLKEIRVETDGKLDIFATAANIGVPLLITNQEADGQKMIGSASISGLSKYDRYPIQIRIKQRISEDEKLLSFGHEVGHFFLHEFPPSHKLNASEEENFCEFFGREMVVSHQELRKFDLVNPKAITDLMGRYGAGHETIIFGLMLAGKLPTRIILDSEIGHVPNPLYSEKVGRSIICLDCELEKPHTGYSEGDGTPILDYRGYEWNNKTAMNACNTRLDISTHLIINHHYGRWSVDDLTMLTEEIMCRPQTQELSLAVSSLLRIANELRSK